MSLESATLDNVTGEAPYLLRLPTELKAIMEQLAKRDRRSLNAEIVYILEQFVKAQPESDD